MRLSTVFVSSTFVLAGMSAAFPVEIEDLLAARFADSDFLSEVEAQAYDEEPELYVHGGAISANNYKTLSRHRRSFYEPSRYELSRRESDKNSEPTQRRVTFAPDTYGPPHRSSSHRSLTPPESERNGFRSSMSNMFRGARTTGSNLFNRFRNRRSFDELPSSELTRRNWQPPLPYSPPKNVHWSPDTVDTPDRPPRSPTPMPSRPHSPSPPNGEGEGEGWNGNGNLWHSQYHHHPRSFDELPRSELSRRHWEMPPPDSPPRRVHWSEDTPDTPDRPRRPPTPIPSRPHSPNGNGNGWHPQRYHPRSFFDLD